MFALFSRWGRQTNDPPKMLLWGTVWLHPTKIKNRHSQHPTILPHKHLSTRNVCPLRDLCRTLMAALAISTSKLKQPQIPTAIECCNVLHRSLDGHIFLVDRCLWGKIVRCWECLSSILVGKAKLFSRAASLGVISLSTPFAKKE